MSCRCAAMTTVQRITAQLLLLFPQGHSFVPKSLGANHLLGPAATFQTANRCCSLCCRQVFTLSVFPAPCCWLWLFGESQSSGGLSVIVVGIFNSLLGNMRWSVSGVPPSGSMGGGGNLMPSSLKRKRQNSGQEICRSSRLTCVNRLKC